MGGFVAGSSSWTGAYLVTPARTSDVSKRFPALLVRVCRERGISPSALLEGLDLSERDLEDPDGYIDWDSDLVILERVEAALGGAGELQHLIAGMALRHPALHYLASLYPSPRSLYRFGLDRAFRRVYPGAGIRVDALPDGRVRLEARLPRTCRGSEAFFRGEIGQLRVIPRIFGQPEAQVEAQIGPYQGIYCISLPPERTLPGRAGREVREALARLRTGEAHPEAARDLDVSLLAQASTFVSDPDHLGAASRPGQALARLRDLPGLGEALANLMRDLCCCDRLALWVVGADPEELTLAFYSGDCRLPFQCGCELRARGRLLGRIEADVPCGSDGGPPPFVVALAPWVAHAVESCLRRCGPRARPSEGTESLSFRVDRARRVWQLTERETQTLSLVAQGLANKEIAERFGCSVKGVEAHLTRLLRKSASDSRATLLVRLIQPGAD
jgi:DNA-binding CsgD family transcriptional regulator